MALDSFDEREKMLEFVFRIFDTNRDGKAQANELQKVIMVKDVRENSEIKKFNPYFLFLAYFSLI
jgi:Ca2+-binding EF-hand superfamily protein